MGDATGDGACDGMAAEGRATSIGKVAGAAASLCTSEHFLKALDSLAPKLDTDIAEMRAQQRALKAEKRKVAQQLRNATKRRRRLRKRSQELPAEDLLEVLAMRRVRDAHSAHASATEDAEK